MKKKLKRLTVTVVILTVMACLLGLPAFAVDIEKEPVPDFLWELDFNKMSSINDNMGNPQYTIEGKNVTLGEVYSKKALGITDNNGVYYINDTGNIIDDYDTFSIEADMFFEKFPSGVNSAGQNPNEAPMSFMTWMTQNEGSSSISYRSIRINSDGYLCTGYTADTKTEAKLPLGEWFKVRFLISPSSGMCEVFVNGQNLLTYKIGAPTNMIMSRVRFFDTRYQYSVYFSNISVYSDSSYRIGLSKEEAADYLAYQTTKAENGSFDLRLISSINIENITTYNNTGFNVTLLWGENGKAKVEERDVKSTEVYDSILSSGKGISASELGTKYLAAVPIDGIPADKGNIEIVVRPFVKKDGIRKYGEPIILIYSGDEKDGYPTLSIGKSFAEYTAYPSDDTFVRCGNNENFGDSQVLELKNSGGATPYTREIYVKFEFSEKALKKLLASNRIYFEFYVNTHRSKMSEEEIAEGGILADICGVDTNWKESELTGNNAPTLAKELEYIGEVRYAAKQYNAIDVTEYVLAHAKDGTVAFKITNIEHDGDSGQMRFASKESATGTPKLTVYPSNFNHEIDLSKMNNEGYEPWGYAEKLVDEWFKTGRVEAYTNTYEPHDLETVDVSKPSGSHTVKTMQNSSAPTNRTSAVKYARTLDSLVGFKGGLVCEYDMYGGITNSGIKGNATGYFHAEQVDGRFYIIDPIGNPFFASGVNTLQIGSTDNQKAATIAKYGSEENAYKAITEELLSTGINTYWGGDIGFFEENKLITAVSTGGIAYYMLNELGLGAVAGGTDRFAHNNTMNVFDPDFASFCERHYAEVVAPYKGSDRVLGFYSDNELPANTDMLYRYLTVDYTEPINAFSYAAAWTWLKRATGNPNPSVNDITPELSEEFKSFIFDTYFAVVTDALNKVGCGDYMYLGTRIHNENETSEGYLRAAGRHLDIISVNLYGGMEPPADTIESIYKYSGRPFVVTEFFAKGSDAVDMNGYALGNQSNAGWNVDTQTDRAIHFENYTLLLIESKSCVGWTWYRFRDNDQTVYRDEVGNLYVAFDIAGAAPSAYKNIQNGNIIDGPGLAPSLTVYYKGESDLSNVGSNKGIYDNKMNIYTELAGSYKKIYDNVFALIDYFDEMQS